MNHLSAATDLAALFDIDMDDGAAAPADTTAWARMKCRKCGGTGKFTGYTGKVLGNCFACKGAGFHMAKPQANQKAIDVSKIEAAFATARARANRPGQMGVWTRPLPLTSTEATGKQTFVFRPGSIGSEWEGMIFVKTKDGRKVGYVKAGKFTPRADTTDAETAAVIECAGDPAAAAKAYGKAWSRCCVCNITLTNDRSIEAGIGPICAEKYGF